jgi:hypothetical protein
MVTAPSAHTIYLHSSRRRISAQAGYGLEKLGHAIEYLTNEFVHGTPSFFPHPAQLEAVQLLMAANREIYFECPEVPTLGARVLSLLRRRAA